MLSYWFTVGVFRGVLYILPLYDTIPNYVYHGFDYKTLCVDSEINPVMLYFILIICRSLVIEALLYYVE